MAGRRRTKLAVEAERRNVQQLARMGAEVRDARVSKRVTQAHVAERAGVSRASVGRAERGLGGGLTLDAWQRIALAIGRPLVARLQYDTMGETADAGHLAMQELVLRLGRAAGYMGRFELPTRPAEPWRSADVGLLDDDERRLVLVECWNTIGDIGAAVRGSARKVVEAEAIALARWGTATHTVRMAWVVRASVRNRAIVGRYPEVFSRAFHGSSRGWIAALTSGTAPPTDPGLVWCDVAATRLFAWRRSGDATPQRIAGRG